MKAGELRRVLAKVTSSHEGTVKIALRHIREGGLMTTGAYGVNAPDMTYLDASRGLIALMAFEIPGKRTVPAVQLFGKLPWSDPALDWEDDQFSLQAFCPAMKLDTFEEALAALICVFSEHRENSAYIRNRHTKRDGTSVPPTCTVTLVLDESFATIQMEERNYSYMERMNIRDPRASTSENTRLGVQRVAFINSHVLQELGDAFAESRCLNGVV